MDDKVQIIKVKSARKDGKVALWEVHPDHPGGEVFVVTSAPTADVPEPKEKVVEVAETPKVLNALKEGQIVKVGNGVAATKAPTKPAGK